MGQRENVFLSLTMLLFGTIGGILSKIQFLTKSDGLPDASGKTLRYFEHPWFQVLLMFLGESLCLVVHFLIVLWNKYFSKPDISVSVEEFCEQQESFRTYTRYPRLLMVLPAFFDLVSSGLLSIGLLWLDASIVNMLRGSLLIFTAALTILIFKRKQTKMKLCGIATTFIGIVIVSVSVLMKSLAGEEGGDKPSAQISVVILGALLVLLSQLITSFQLILEEYVLKNVKITPFEVVGYQGIFGSILTSFVLIILQYMPGNSPTTKSQEDTLDAFVKLKNSSFLLATVVAYIFLIFIFNICSMYITKKLSALYRAIISNLRSLSIWLVEIFIFYALNNRIYGKALDAFSFTKIDGFALLIIGTILYTME